MDTWERESRVAQSTAYTDYCRDKGLLDTCQVCDDGDTLHDARHAAWTLDIVGEPNHVHRMRRLILENRKAHNLNKRASDNLYTVWADAGFFGLARCQRGDRRLRGRCIYCTIILGNSKEETTRHAHLECPFTQLVLDTAYRSMLQVSATNARNITHYASLSPTQLTTQRKTALVTGLRSSDTSRAVPSSPAKDTPFMNLIAATHLAITDHLHHNNNCCDLDDTLAPKKPTEYNLVGKNNLSHPDDRR